MGKILAPIAGQHDFDAEDAREAMYESQMDILDDIAEKIKERAKLGFVSYLVEHETQADAIRVYFERHGFEIIDLSKEGTFYISWA